MSNGAKQGQMGWLSLCWWVTILGLGVTLLGMVVDHPWQLSPGVSFAIKVLVPDYKSVVHFFLEGDHPRFGG